MLEKTKTALKPYAKSKRVWVGTVLLILMGAVTTAGVTINPWIAVGVYFAGNILTKRIDLKK